MHDAFSPAQGLVRIFETKGRWNNMLISKALTLTIPPAPMPLHRRLSCFTKRSRRMGQSIVSTGGKPKEFRNNMSGSLPTDQSKENQSTTSEKRPHQVQESWIRKPWQGPRPWLQLLIRRLSGYHEKETPRSMQRAGPSTGRRRSY